MAAFVLLALGFGSNNVRAALVSDLLPPEWLGMGLALFQDTFWLATMVGLALTGAVFTTAATRAALLGWTGSLLAAAFLPLWIRLRARVVGVPRPAAEP